MQIPVTKWNIFFICLGITLIVTGVTLLSCISWCHEQIIKSALKFAPGSSVYTAWQKPEAAIMMDIYFFNWTNPEDINNPDIKPKFVEVGPYRYKQYKEKTNITWFNENQTITYQYLKHFYFDEENSPRHHSDDITTVNMIAFSSAKLTSDWNPLIKLITSSSIESEKIHITKNVSDLLFNGYEDRILSKASTIPFIGSGEDRFGWFYGKNGTIGTDGVFNMKYSPDQDYATIQSWNYDNETYFFDDDCDDVYGSAGEMYSRNVQPNMITVYSAEMCRTVQFNFEKNVTVKGLHGYKFSPGIEVFDNGQKLKDNVCYDNSLPSGVLNMSACKNDAPVYLSLPHFYYADPFYVNAVEGLHPDKEKHELYVVIEPNTGIIADILGRLQINVLLQPIPEYTLFASVQEVMIPIVWFSQQVVISDEVVSGLKLLLFHMQTILEVIFLIIITVGLICIICVIFFVTCLNNKKKLQTHTITKEEIPLNCKS